MNIQWSSRDRAGIPSLAAVLTVGPMLTGGPHGACLLDRCDTQTSLGSAPPGRLKKRLRPSLEIADPRSETSELTTGPRFIGGDQSPNRGASSSSSPSAVTMDPAPAARKATTIPRAMIDRTTGLRSKPLAPFALPRLRTELRNPSNQSDIQLASGEKRRGATRED